MAKRARPTADSDRHTAAKEFTFNKMSRQLPIILQSILNMSEAPLFLPEKSFRFNSLTMENDRYVCVRDQTAEESNQFVIIDMHNNNSVTKRPTKKAEAAIMNPCDNIIALKGKADGKDGHFVQIFNLNTKERLGEYQFDNEVVFWRWCGPRLFAVVTSKAVFHWDVSVVKNDPELIFCRGGKLAELNVQIINYATDRSTAVETSWCLLTCISMSTNDKKVIDGCMQLYSIEKKQQQFLEGHAGCFGTVTLDEQRGPLHVISFAERKGGVSKLHVMDIRSPRVEGAPIPFKVSTEIPYPVEAPNDFPISEYISSKYGVAFLITKAGYLLVFDVATATLIFMHRVSQDTVFLSTSSTKTGGILLVNRKGNIISATVNEGAVISYIQNQLRATVPNCANIAMSLARRHGYEQADGVLTELFNQLFAKGDFRGAANVIVTMKSGNLRTAQILNRFKTAMQTPGQPSPILQYFSTILDHGSLNALESLEIVRPVVAQGRRDFVEKWVNEEKLEFTEELGDIVRPMDSSLALQIYKKAKAVRKVLHCLIDLSRFDQVFDYAKSLGQKADYSPLIRAALASSPEACVKLSTQLLSHVPPLADAEPIVEVFLQQNRIQELTVVLLEVLKPNMLEHSSLQTKLLEINLRSNAQAAEAIFQMELFSHYDRYRIGLLCEQAGLHQRALEHFTEANDVKRIMMHCGGALSPEWMTTYFGRMPPEACLEILADMLRTSRTNLQTVVAACTKQHERIGTGQLIKMFELQNCNEGLFYFLGSILAISKDPVVHFKYIEAAAKLNHLQEVERVCRESQFYDPKQVKEFLMETQLQDPRPLIYVCDLHGFVDELTRYLYKQSLTKFIEVYVCKVNPQQTPTVVGVLLDVGCSEDFIHTILNNVRAGCAAGVLVDAVEKRNRLRLLLPWLEARLSEGMQDVDVHNALAKIYIDTNKDPESFLLNNPHYDSKAVGKYCEDRDPHLAFTAYKRAFGKCDRELIDLTNKNGLFRLQAKYLVQRQSPELWKHVLTSPNNDEFKRSVVDQVVSSALPDATTTEEVSVTVQAFLEANLPAELIELLEQLVLHAPGGSSTCEDFSNNRNLQDLLLLQAIKCDSGKVADYINRLDNFDATTIAAIAKQDGLYEEAFQIYKKREMFIEAVNVLLEDIKSIIRASEYAAAVDMPAVWSRLSLAELERGDVAGVIEAIECCLRAQDASQYQEVIPAALRVGRYDELVRFLHMARASTTIKDQMIDTELAYSLARCFRLRELDEYLLTTSTANVLAVGDRIFEEGCSADTCGDAEGSGKLLQAAKTLFKSISNNARLASCFLRTKEFDKAVEAARLANNAKVWKEVAVCCVTANDFSCAHVAGINIAVYPDHLDDLIRAYEDGCHFDHLITLLESALTSERAHVGLYTETGIAYAKYAPAKLSGYLQLAPVSSGKVNIPKLVKSCNQNLLWKEAVMLHTLYDEFDHAAMTTMQHGSSCWAHEEFCTILGKVTNSETAYKGITFYCEEHPLMLCGLLASINHKVDNTRVVAMMREHGNLPLISSYLKKVQQKENILAVNDALNSLAFDEENVIALRESILAGDSFDQVGLANLLANHELLELRRIAALLYRRNKRFDKAVMLSKKDGALTDAMTAARESSDPAVVEELLRHLLFERKDKAAFAACLQLCYDLVPPHLVLELVWRSGATDFAMPFLIQSVKDLSTKIESLSKKTREPAVLEKSAPNDFGGPTDLQARWNGVLSHNLALMPPNRNFM